MSLFSGVSDFFGLDIGTTAIRVVQVRGGGTDRALMRYAYAPVNAKVTQSDSPADRQALVDAILALVAQAGITTKNVAVGVPSSRSFVTFVDLPRLEQAEMKKTILYQADNFIPQQLDQVKLDWAILGDSPVDHDKLEVMLATVPNDFSEARLNALEAAGLNVIAFEPDALALVRALIPAGTTTATMILDVGNQATDIIVTLGDAPRLVRSLPTGGQAFVKAAMAGLSIDEAQAQQFVYKFGLSQDKLEGQIYKAISHSVDSLISEFEKSVKFFKTRYNTDISKVIVTGGASTLPEFPLYLANHLSLPVEIGNTWANVSYPKDRYNELVSVSSQFGIATGLALRVE